jgi:hypothetical protein
MNETTQIQLLFSVALVYAQNWLKQQPWFPLITYEQSKINGRINNIFSIIATGAAALGIHFAFNSQTHELVISGLQLSSIGAFAFRWAVGYLGSKLTYTALKDKLNPPAPLQQGFAKALPGSTEIKH